MLEAFALVIHADGKAMALQFRVLVHVLAFEGRTWALARLHGIWAAWKQFMVLSHAVESMKVVLLKRYYQKTSECDWIPRAYQA